MTFEVLCKFLWFHDSLIVHMDVHTPTILSGQTFVWLLCERSWGCKNVFRPSPHLVRKTLKGSGSRRNGELGLPQKQLGVADRHHLLEEMRSKCPSWSQTQLCFDGACRMKLSFTSGLVYLMLLQQFLCLYSNNGHLLITSCKTQNILSQN